MAKYYLILIIICITSGCTGKKTESSIPIDTLVVNFYADSLVLGEEAKITSMDSTAYFFALDSIYRRYGVTKDLINRSVQTYQKDLQTWKKFYEMLVRRLEYLRTKE